ncbi:DUF4296 domain-containing protein [Flavobacteriaceae bacterium F08102]|nr:DUF4296 domain-containing protein [Flavobacteriaceae bacterium F08102]
MRNWIFLFSFIILIGCTNVVYNKPKDLINKEKMMDIWTDILLGSAAKSLQTKDLKNYKNIMPVILKKYQIDSAQFMRSNYYYTTRIDDYETMFEDVEKRLKALKRTYDPKGAALDSIQSNHDIPSDQN